jgi:DNA-binding transcriptional LysR family regulator
MTIDQLTYFVEAARHQHLGKAARTLAISQSAISHSIATLEKELGRDLFRKEGRQVFLTSHGRVLAERAQQILEEIDTLTDDLLSDRTELQRRYRLGAPPGIVAHGVTPAWARLVANHPRLSVEILSLRSADTLERVANGELDFGVCLAAQPHPKVHAEPLAEGRSLVVVRRGHRLTRWPADRAALSLADFPYIGAIELAGISPCGNHPAFRSLPRPPAPAFLYDSYDVAVAQLAHSEGWAIFPEWIWQKLGRDKLLPLPGLGTMTVTLHGLWPKARALSKIGAELMGYLRDALQSPPPIVKEKPRYSLSRVARGFQKESAASVVKKT